MNHQYYYLEAHIQRLVQELKHVPGVGYAGYTRLSRVEMFTISVSVPCGFRDRTDVGLPWRVQPDATHGRRYHHERLLGTLRNLQRARASFYDSLLQLYSFIDQDEQCLPEDVRAWMSEQILRGVHDDHLR